MTRLTLSREEAAAFLVDHHRLNRFHYDTDRAGLKRMLDDLRCIQLDPLAPLGTSPDMVVHARGMGYRMGEMFSDMLGPSGFEHYAKERCLLPLSAFPYYRAYARRHTWARLNGWLTKSLAKVPARILDAVEAEVAARGPLAPSALSDHGQVVPMDWSGWKGTAKTSTLALEILWAQCRVVVCGRTGREKIYDVPERLLGTVPDPEPEAFHRWALEARVDAAGLLPRASGPHWSMLEGARAARLPEALLAEGLLVEVAVDGAPGRYLARPTVTEHTTGACDDAMRILGPLDPLLWYRPLVAAAFDFTYIWEVYKPADQRRWGWYVCPLLHSGRLVGRLEGRARDGRLVIDTVWRQKDRKPDRDALKAALARHATAMGLDGFTLPRGYRTTPA